MRSIRSYVGLAALVVAVLLPAWGEGRQAAKKGPVKAATEEETFTWS